MFEAKLNQAGLLKKILESVKDLVTDANFDCSSSGISLQAMDSSHVSLVSLLLRADGFEQFRADKSGSLGINLNAMTKILKCASNDDSVTIKSEEKGDHVNFIFESPKGEKFSDFELKLLDIDSEVLGIPDTEYKTIIKMPSSEFQKICRDLTILGDTVIISATKEGVKFSVTGEIGNANISLKPTGDVDSKPEESVSLQIEEPVQLTFALRYLNFFTKATALSGSVSLSMSKDVPLVVEYRIDDLGYIRYYLAPKIEESDS